MPPNSADAPSLAAIRQLALDLERVWISKTVQWDLLSHKLRLGDVCDAIIDWIDAGQRVKPVTLHTFPGRIGQAAYEMKPTLKGKIYYLKVTIDDRGMSCEKLGILSVHPDH